MFFKAWLARKFCVFHKVIRVVIIPAVASIRYTRNTKENFFCFEDSVKTGGFWLQTSQIFQWFSFCLTAKYILHRKCHGHWS